MVFDSLQPKFPLLLGRQLASMIFHVFYQKEYVYDESQLELRRAIEGLRSENRVGRLAYRALTRPAGV